MSSQILVQNDDDFPDTHFFVYRDKKYPIKLDFFKISSKFFSKNLAEIERIQNIQLIDEETEKNINLPEEVINDFVKFIHHTPISLNNENIIALNYLSKKYEVLSLLKLTNNYISEHHDELAIQILLIHQDDPNFTTETYEYAISKHFPEYIKDDHLLLIKIPILYRILTNYQNDHERSNQIDLEIFDFLFKCLDKYGREASVLFSSIDFGGIKLNYLNLLLTKYSKVFDFNFINSAICKTLYEQQSELLRREIENQKCQEEFQRQMNLELERVRAGFAKELSLQKQKEEESMLKMKEEMKRIKDELEQKLLTQKSEYEKEIKMLKDEMKEQTTIEMQRKLFQAFEYDGNIEHTFSGIIHHLTETCGGNVHEKGIVEVTASSTNSKFYPKFAVDLDNLDNYFHSESQQNSWLKYDFKQKKIHPTKYSIRSRHWGRGHEHLKNWVIEGSNSGGDDDWVILDRRNDVTCLDDRYAKAVFVIQKKLSDTEFYRYIRLRITGVCSDGREYYIKISALEFFGSIIK